MRNCGNLTNDSAEGDPAGKIIMRVAPPIEEAPKPAQDPSPVFQGEEPERPFINEQLSIINVPITNNQ